MRGNRSAQKLEHLQLEIHLLLGKPFEGHAYGTTVFTRTRIRLIRPRAPDYAAGLIAMPIEPSRLHSRKPIVRKQGSPRLAYRRIRWARLNSQEPIAAEEVKPAGLRRSPTTLRVLRASGIQPLASLKRSLRA